MDRPPRPSWLYFLVGAISFPVLKLLYRLRATGREHVPDGGCVLAATKRIRSRSRSTTSRVATDWTRPAESRGMTFFQSTGETSKP